MNDSLPRRYDHLALLAFAFTAVASITLQNFIWISIALFLFFAWRNNRKIEWPRNGFAIATLIFLASFYLGCIVGVNPTKSFESVHKYLVFLILFPLGAMSLTLADIRKTLHVFIAGASICSIYGIIKYFVYHQDRIDSFSGDKMVFGGLLMATLLIELCLLKDPKSRPWILTTIILTGSALFLTQTRGAWVGFGVGFILLFWRFNRKWLFAGLILLFGLYFVLPQHFQDRVKSVGHFRLYYDSQGHFYNSDPGRFMIWVSGWHIFQDHPWGIGQENIVDVYPRYKFAIMAEPTEPHLHDNFLQILVQNGWIGLLIYLFWIGAYYVCAIRYRPENESEADLNWTFVCIFTATLAWGLTEYTFAQQYSTVFAFLLGLQMVLWKNSVKKT